MVDHDRGAHVAYRAALDVPERVKGVTIMDVVPISHYWGSMNLEKGHRVAHRSSHWVS